MYIQEQDVVSIPEIPEKNTTVEFVKAHLNEIASISFLEVEADTDNNYLGRPSFRDLMAFNFQPQNIVTNPNTLFYKADTSDHRTKLINIFPYVLNAVTPDLLAKRQEIARIEKEITRKERDLNKIKDVADKWKEELKSWLSSAVELGLIETREITENITFENQVVLLEQVSNKKAIDSTILKKNIEESAQEIIELRKEESDASFNLAVCKSRFTEMSQLMESVQDYRKSLTIQVERLHISKWLKSLSRGENMCPLCKKVDEHPTRVSLLIDIQAKIRDGKGSGYEHWARIFNIKEAAKTLIFLKENGIDSYDDLVEKANAASKEFSSLSITIKDADKRLAEISELQKQIGTYGKTRDIYAQYSKAKNKEKFFEEHRAEITLHIAAKNYFNEQGYSKDNKLPTIASLKQEYATLSAEKKKCYSGYRDLKSNMQELLIAKGNADKILGIKPKTQTQNISNTKNPNKDFDI